MRESGENYLMNVVLTGFMGTGKTAVGKELARALRMKFINTDDLIEEESKLTIPQIFDKFGEEHFRQIEREMVARVSNLDNYVISTGGGVVLDPDNIQDLKRNGIVVCLKASPDAILKRTSSEKHRPLLEGAKPKEKIEKLLSYREPYYSISADYTIDTSSPPVDKIVAEIIKYLRGHKQ